MKPFTDKPLKEKRDTFASLFKPKLPWLGVTQGGSNRKPPGAKIAAKQADIQKKAR